MGKNNNNNNNNGSSWLNAVKNAFRSPVKDADKRGSRRREEIEQEDEEKKRGKRRWIFSKPIHVETTIQHTVAKVANSPGRDCRKREIQVKKELKKDESVSDQTRSIAAIEIVRLTNKSRPSHVDKDQEAAAIVIQSIFRGYLARRALQALKGVVKLQAIIRGHNVRKRAKTTLQCIQSLVRVQAQVCDQRRRLSCESASIGSMVNQANNGRKSTSTKESKVSNTTREEIRDLIEKAKECSLKQGKTLAHALSQQIWSLDEDHFSDSNYEHDQWSRNDRNLFIQRDPRKTVEIDTSRPQSYAISSPLFKKQRDFSVYSPKTPSSSKIKSIQVHSSSPRYTTEERNYQKVETPTLCANYYHRMSTSEKSCENSRPNYMAATASAMARLRSVSVPRQRPSSPNREHTGSAKKRLSFPVYDS